MIDLGQATTAQDRRDAAKPWAPTKLRQRIAEYVAEMERAEEDGK